MSTQLGLHSGELQEVESFRLVRNVFVVVVNRNSRPPTSLELSRRLGDANPNESALRARPSRKLSHEV